MRLDCPDLHVDRRSPPESKIALFRASFAGAMTFTLGGSKAAGLARRGIRLLVATSGRPAFAKSRGSNALLARTSGFCQSPMTSFAGICPAGTTRDTSSSWAFTR